MKKLLLLLLLIPSLCWGEMNPYVAGVVVGGGVSASDNFNRTNSATLGNLSGGTYSWTEVTGGIDIESTTAVNATGSAGVSGYAVLNAAVDVNSGTIICDLDSGAFTWGKPGVIFGYEDSDNFWVLQTAPSSGTENLRLVQYVAGSDSVIVGYDASLATDTSYEVTVRFTSTTVQVDVAGIGANLINTSGQTIASGNVGIYVFNNNDTDDNIIDDWSFVE